MKKSSFSAFFETQEESGMTQPQIYQTHRPLIFEKNSSIQNCYY